MAVCLSSSSTTWSYPLLRRHAHGVGLWALVLALLGVLPLSAADDFLVTAITPQTAGSSFTITVTARTAMVTDSAYVGTITFTSSDPQAVLPANQTFVMGDNGSKDFSVELRTAGLQTITVQDVGTPTTTGTSNTILIDPAAASTLVVGGFSDPVTAGVSDDVTVTARDAFGNTDVNYAGTVTITSSDGAAVLPLASGLTNGVATFAVELRTVGERSISAGDGTLSGSQAAITVQPAAASTLVVGGFSDPVTAGVSDDVTVTARDAFGNTDVNYAGTVTITSDDGLAVLPSASGLTNGVATFAVELRTAGERSISAGDGTLSGSQAAITVQPAAASTLVVGGFSDPVTAGVSDDVTVTARDAFGNTDVNYAGTVTITSSDPDAVLPAASALTAGVGVFSVELRTAGSRSISAGDGSLSAAQSGIDVVAAAASQLAIISIPVAATADVLFSPQPIIHIHDAFGNLVDDDTTTVTATLSTGTNGRFKGTKTVTAVNGVATFTNLVHERSENIVIAFNSTPALTGASSPTITVSPGTVASLGISGFPSPVAAGTATTVTVTALDGAGNTVTGYTGTIHFTSDDAQAVLPADYTFVVGDNGVKTFTTAFQLRTMGTRSITATDTVSASVTGTQGGITVTPATAVQLVFTTQPGSATAGSAFASQPVVRTRDLYGNNSTVGLAATVPVTLSLISGSGTLAGTTSINVGTSGTPGIASFTGLRLDDASDTKVLTASATLDGASTMVASTSFSVLPDVAHHLAIQTQPPATVVAGATFAPAPVVAIRDQFNNLRSGDTLPITVARNAGAGVLQGTTTVNAVGGLATFSALSHPTANDITIRFTSGALQAATSSTVSVTAGSAAALKITGSATQVAGSANAITITAIDALGNTVGGYAGAVALTFAGGNSSTNPVTAPTVDNASALPIAFGAPTTVTFTSGVASTNLRMYRVEAATVTVSDGTLNGIGANALTVNVTAAAATRLVLTGPATLTAGAVGNITITATDPYGNTDTTYVGSHALTFSGASSSTNPVTAPTVENSAGTQIAFGVATSLSFTAGVSSVSGGANGELRLFQAGTPVISASAGTISAAGSDRLSLTVGHAAESKLVVTGSASQTAGETQDITLTIQDAYGNTATSSSSNRDVTFAGTGVGSGYNSLLNQPRVSRRANGAEINFGLPTSLQFVAGVASTAVDPVQCRMRLVRTGAASITATASGLSASTPLLVTVVGGPATQLAITDVNGGADPTAGAAISVVVESQDAGGNPSTPAATTTVGLNLNHGSPLFAGSLTGTITGTISTSQTAIIISGVRCNQVGTTPFWLTASDITSPANATVLAAGDSATFTVLNDTPSVTIDNASPLAYIGGSGSRVLDANATISDVSSSFPDYFAGGTLTASISAGGLASEDVLLILSSAPIITTGGMVYHNDLLTQIGTYAGGTANTTLTVTLNANATPAAVDALIKRLAYFNLAGTVPTTSTRTIQVRLTDGLGAASAYAARTVVPAVGNELPAVTTNTGLTVSPSMPVTPITTSNLQTVDLDNPPADLLYTVTATPNQGGIERNGLPLAVNDTFTQADVDAGLLQYRYVPGPLASVSFTFTVEDGVNQPLPAQAFVIAIQGAAQNPIITLPSGTLVYTERSTTAVVIEANAPNSAQTTISDNFSPNYDNSTLDVAFVDGSGLPASDPGDQISIRDQTLACPLPVLYPDPPDQSTGWIALSGGVVYHRQYPFYYYWANNAVGYPVFTGTFPSPSPPVGYPQTWYFGVPLPLDYPIADVDPTLDGTNGKALRLHLRSGIAPIPDFYFGTTQYLITRTSVARLIANTAFRSTSFDPPTTTRSLRFTLTVGAASGTTGVPVGVASRQVQVSPVNDPPSFLSTSLSLTTLAGIPLNAVVAATDQEAAQTLTYSIVSNSAPASGTVTLNSSTGGFTFVPQTAFAGTTVVVIRATDSLGASTGTPGNPADATVTITTLAGTTTQQPFVISDPPLEVEEGSQFGVSTLSAYTISVLTNETRGPASVTVQLVGNHPVGTTVTTGPVATSAMAPYLASFSLTSTLPISRPPGVSYQFGLRVIADYGGGVTEVGYQPITLRVRALGAAN